mmetsp:Transcript_10818/g.45409  ORF Transcript_10818/g.45409 Transcript_10818/m.45409 type:complete len:337 (+) Transcript_10818:744-1754(+)
MQRGRSVRALDQRRVQEHGAQGGHESRLGGSGKPKAQLRVFLGTRLRHARRAVARVRRGEPAAQVRAHDVRRVHTRQVQGDARRLREEMKGVRVRKESSSSIEYAISKLPRPHVWVRARSPAEQKLGGVYAPLALGGGRTGNSRFRRVPRVRFVFSLLHARQTRVPGGIRNAIRVAAIAAILLLQRTVRLGSGKVGSLAVPRAVRRPRRRPAALRFLDRRQILVGFRTFHLIRGFSKLLVRRAPPPFESLVPIGEFIQVADALHDVLAQLFLDALDSVAVETLVFLNTPLELVRGGGHRFFRLQNALFDPRHVLRPARLVTSRLRRRRLRRRRALV